jgi:hypothetical protein
VTTRRKRTNGQAAAANTRAPVGSRTVKHNWSHDLESYLWLALWFISMRLLFDPATARTACRHWGAAIFNEASSPSPTRWRIFTGEDLPDELEHHLPSEYEEIIDGLEFIRSAIHTSHLERGPEEHRQTYHAPYFSAVRAGLELCRSCAERLGSMPLETFESVVALNATPKELEVIPNVEEPSASVAPPLAKRSRPDGNVDHPEDRGLGDAAAMVSSGVNDALPAPKAKKQKH